MKTRHATHPPAVPMVERDAEGGGGWGAAEGPWTGGETKVRTPDDDDCQSMVQTTRPSMSLMHNAVKPIIDTLTQSLRCCEGAKGPASGCWGDICRHLKPGSQRTLGHLPVLALHYMFMNS